MTNRQPNIKYSHFSKLLVLVRWYKSDQSPKLPLFTTSTCLAAPPARRAPTVPTGRSMLHLVADDVVSI